MMFVHANDVWTQEGVWERSAVALMLSPETKASLLWEVAVTPQALNGDDGASVRVRRQEMMPALTECVEMMNPRMILG